jgi:RNA polymerase sigma-70 factor, ECF subfamily
VPSETIVIPGELPGIPPPLPTQIELSEINDLFAACIPKLAKTARRLVRTAEDSEDLLQDSLLSAFKHLDQFQGRSKFSTWLHSIVCNKAKMRFRSAQAHPCYSLDEQTSDSGELWMENSSTPGQDAEEKCVENERSRILRETLLRVPPSYRVVIQVCDIEGLSGPDAAERLGVTLPALKTRLHRARKSVAAKIRQHYRVDKAASPTIGSQAKQFLRVRAHSDARAERKGGSAGEYDEVKPAPRRAVRGSRASMRKKVAIGVRYEESKRSASYYAIGAGGSAGPVSLSRAL